MPWVTAVDASYSAVSWGEAALALCAATISTLCDVSSTGMAATVGGSDGGGGGGGGGSGVGRVALRGPISHVVILRHGLVERIQLE